jgi:hypothetical protein
MSIVAVAVVFATLGTTYGLGGFDWLSQQKRLDQPPAGSPLPTLVGERVTVASTDQWAVLAWWSNDSGLCIDVAFSGQGATGCGLPIAGATAQPLPFGKQELAAGVGAVEGRGPQVVVGGVAAPNVARVDLVLVDDRTVPTTMHDAPAALATTVRFFVSRFDYTGPLPPPQAAGLVTKYLAYDGSGQFLGASPK